MADSQSVRNVKALFKNRKADHMISANILASAINRHGKTTRAHLRTEHKRDDVLKNSNWQITKAIALEAAMWSDRAKRTKSDDKSE